MKALIKVYWEDNSFERVNNQASIDYTLYSGSIQADITALPVTVNLKDYLDSAQIDYIISQVPTWNGAIGVVANSVLVKNQVTGYDEIELYVNCVAEGEVC
jgi:hypothetical protein